MSVIRVGSSGTYASGWDAIFGAGKAKLRKKTSSKASKAATPKAARRFKKSSKRR